MRGKWIHVGVNQCVHPHYRQATHLLLAINKQRIRISGEHVVRPYALMELSIV